MAELNAVPLANMKWHPASKEDRSSDCCQNEHIYKFSQEEKGEFQSGIFRMESLQLILIPLPQGQKDPGWFQQLPQS